MKPLLCALVFCALLGCAGPDGTPATKTQTAQVRPGCAYELYPGPQPETMREPPGEVFGGSAVEVLETRGEWARIRQGELEGWIPRWYLSDDGTAPVSETPLDYRVLNRDTGGALYPGGPRVTELTKGKLLKPLKEWGDWVEVAVTVYDLPAVQTAWIPKDCLSPVGRAEPREGFLRQGSQVYEGAVFEGIGKVAPEVTAHEMPVIIRERRDGYVRVGGAGGWDGWTREENVTFGESTPTSVHPKYLRTELAGSEYWLDKRTGYLYRVDRNQPTKKLGCLGTGIKDLGCLEAHRTPAGNVLLVIEDCYGEPHINHDLYTVYIRGDKVVHQTHAYYSYRYERNVNFYKDLVIMNAGRTAYVVDDRSGKIVRGYDLDALGGRDDNYFIEGFGDDFLLIRPNTDSFLTLIDLRDYSRVVLYKELLDKAEREFVEASGPPMRGDYLQFIEEKDGVLYFKNRRHEFIGSEMGKDERVYQYSLTSGR